MSQSSDNGPPSAVFLERMWLDGAMVAGVGYGCNVSLFFHGCFLLYPTWKKSRINRFLLVYLIVLFLLATIFTSTKFKSTELAFVDHRDSPGGPTQYQLFSADAGATVNAVTYVISNWLADAVLVRWFSKIRPSSLTLEMISDSFGAVMLSTNHPRLTFGL